MSIIKLQNISKSHDKPILENINLVINEGEFVVITGSSGSGKSTLLQILGLIEPSSSGQYWLGGRSVEELAPKQLCKIRHNFIGFIFQRYHLVKHLSILDNVLLPLQYGDHINGNQRATKLLDQLGMLEHLHKQPNQLSYGQQQRVSIARAFISQPKIILADEPTGALDDSNSTIVLEKLRSLHGGGQTIIMITHDQSLIQPGDIHYHIEDKRVERVL